MKSRIWILSCILALVAGTTAALTVMGGYGNGNGGDRIRPENNSSWFVSTPRPTYCVMVGDAFRVPLVQFQEIFSSVEDNWRKYVREKRLAWFQVPKFEYRETCESDTNLKIYLGTTATEVENTARDYDNPVAFVKRTYFDASSGESRGFMWIHGVPDQIDWERPGRLFGILSHEMGHMLGCEHVDGTIMDKSVELLLSNRNRYEEGFFRNIDLERDLIPCENCSFEFLGSQKFRPTFRLFSALTGRSYSGQNVTSILRRDSDSTDPDASWAAGGHYSWELRDELENYVFSLHFFSVDQPWVHRAEFPASLFKVWTSERQYQEQTFGGTLAGTLNAVSGKKFSFYLTYNQFSGKRSGYPSYTPSNGKWVLSVVDPEGAEPEIVFSISNPE